jgi:hypothetical protein
LLAPSEEVTRTWVKRKGILIKSRPEPSRFSFIVCLAIVFSIAFGFFGGFITAGFTLKENFSSVYENLIAELENTRRCIEREKEKLISLNQLNSTHDGAIPQPVFSLGSPTTDLVKDGCKDANHFGLANDEWSHQTQYLVCKDCH